MQINGTNPIYGKNKNKPSFSGHTIARDERGNTVYKFYLPNNPQNIQVETALLQKHADGNFTFIPGTSEKHPLANGIYEYKPATDVLTADKTVGYRFIIDGEHKYFDYAKCINDEKAGKFTVATPPTRSGHTIPRQMGHLFPDSLLDFTNLSEEKRNHFNHLGGTLNTINNHIDIFKDFGVKRILSTPVFGQDTVSSHGYWTSNAYQITSTLGNIDDFKNLQVNLFKNGMGWVADGAFVNEGLHGVHIKDVMTWNSKSPFFDWFSTKNVQDYGLQFGILSKQPDTRKHTHYRLVNARHKIVFEKTANGMIEKEVVRNKDYRSTKPTYVQIFDDRLATLGQVNSSKVFDVYENKNADDKFEINNYKDAVQPYAFRVSPFDVEKNYLKYEEAKHADKKAEFKDYLTVWTNFEFVPSNKDGGVGTWVGNTDIPKKRFMISEKSIVGLPEEKVELLKAAPWQVQDDTIQIGKFWTSETARTLLDYTASQIYDELESAGDYKTAIKNLIKNNKLPKAAEAAIEGENGKTPLDNLLNVKSSGERDYNLKKVPVPESIAEGLMAFPMDAIEYSNDLTSVLAYPWLKNFAVDEKTVGKSRFELYKMGDEFYSKMPSKYRELYQQTDKFIAEEMTQKATEIFKAAGTRAGIDMVDSHGNLTADGREAYSIVAADIAKFLYVSALTPQINPAYKDGRLTYDTDELKSVYLETLDLQYAHSPEEAAKMVLHRLKRGVKKLNENRQADFEKFLAKKLEKFDTETVNAARLVIEKAEAGLDWRIDAAKDVGDWDAVDAGKMSERECYDKTAGFWEKFNSAVRKFNPNTFTIGELVLDMEHNNQDFGLKNAFQETFNSRTGFTTETDYNFLYSSPMELFGADLTDSGGLNHHDNIDQKTRDIINGATANRLYDNVNFAHVFSGNHDKPRILHLLGLNLAIFKDDKAKAMEDLFHRALENNMVKDEINKQYGEYKETLRRAVHDLSEGKYTHISSIKHNDSENFGTRPYRQNIDDVFLQAAYMDDKFKNNIYSDKGKIDYLRALLLKGMLFDPMRKAESMLFYQVGMPGSPTVYMGDEIGETGWETPCKNEFQNNRNRLHYEVLDDDRYKFIQEYRTNLKNIMNIRNQKAATPLVNGASIPLQGIALKEGGNAAVVYRYNDKSDAICVFHNRGYGKLPHERGLDSSVDEISLEQSGEFGLPNALAAGTVYYDALCPSNKYEVKVENNVAKLYNTGGGPIQLGNKGIILLREKGFNGEDYFEEKQEKDKKIRSVSFHGRKANPYVALANLKYNIR